MAIIIPYFDVETFNVIRFVFVSFLILPFVQILRAQSFALVRKYQILSGKKMTTISNDHCTPDSRGLAIAIIVLLLVIGQGLLEFGVGSVNYPIRVDCELKAIRNESSIHDSSDWFEILEISQECDLRENAFRSTGYSSYNLSDGEDPNADENSQVKLFAEDPYTYHPKAFAMASNNQTVRVNKDESLDLQIIKNLTGKKKGDGYDLIHLDNLRKLNESDTKKSLRTFDCNSEECIFRNAVGTDKLILVFGEQDFVLCNRKNYHCMRFFSTKRDGIILHPATIEQTKEQSSERIFEVFAEENYDSLTIPNMELTIGSIGLFILANHRYMDLVLEAQYAPVSAYVDLMSMVVSVSLDKTFTMKRNKTASTCIEGEKVRPVLLPRGIAAIGVFVGSIFVCAVVVIVTLLLFKMRKWDLNKLVEFKIGSDSKYVLELSHEMTRDGGNNYDSSDPSIGIVLQRMEDGTYSLGIGPERGDAWDGSAPIRSPQSSRRLLRRPSRSTHSCDFCGNRLDYTALRKLSVSTTSSSDDNEEFM